jgi:hypothetical protein
MLGGKRFGIRVGPKWSVIKYVINNYCFNFFQIWCEASLGQGGFNCEWWDKNFQNLTNYKNHLKIPYV